MAACQTMLHVKSASVACCTGREGGATGRIEREGKKKTDGA